MANLGSLKEFTPILRETIIPYLREDGFKGSVPTFRWIKSPVIQMINFQGTPLGRACFINIGIHLEFFPIKWEGGPKKIKYHNCIFRDRLNSPLSFIDFWPYTRESADKMIEHYVSKVRPFFYRFRLFPDAFLLISPEELQQRELSKLPTPHAKILNPYLVAKMYTELYEYIGDNQTAQKFSKVAEYLK